VIKKAIVPIDAIAMKPLPLNRTNMAKVANELINEPYGWGGLYRNRDCSAMIMDLFAPFGVWLPRNSRHQALEGGAFVDLRDVSAKAKEKMILKDGIPYMTLLWLKGHIMLYMGSYNGEILVFHNFWSARDKKSKRKTSKQIVGHAAITTLQPGSKSKRHRQGRGYLNEIIGMTVIGNKIPQTINN
jgi:cell wall-associated NlpC family hydrolase